ncbi:MAG: ester cyclase [Chloroflexi bacterium]|nr:ester cyclase [Chloroflexota bacterium]
MTENEKALARRYFEAWNLGDMAILDEILAPDFVHYDPALPGTVRSAETFGRQVVTMFRTAFPDLEFTMEDVIAEADRVAIRWRAKGSQRGEVMGIAPTGITAEVTGIELLRVVGTNIVESWTNWGHAGLVATIERGPHVWGVDQSPGTVDIGRAPYRAKGLVSASCARANHSAQRRRLCLPY